MSSAAQRKRRTTGSPLVSRPSTKTSRRANTRRTANANRAANGNRAASRVANRAANISRTSDGDPPTETIDVMDNTEDSVEEVVDLTCEASETAVVDLTNNDSVLLVDEGTRNRRVTTGESYVVSSDEDEDIPHVLSTSIAPSLHTSSSSRSTPGTISCPICLDSYSEITESGRLVVSTKCGHVFCSQCLRDTLTSSHTCPTCRKRLTHRQYHPLYI
uniref:RING finger protein 4 n=1 Tax=Scatophagus argus TaxID=75038 RepID=UPI001ED7E18D|nr:RING finger protein 4 [Scatophagus argus]XP_046262048.1 RING finger protein 4 [Scatophagus argus]XP_046262049.1 RING finger protein 4 [Scatophagus argus]XP_046262050.1 RING finger protein 4 [Scatophagus argus]XP_046262051.1 RING finger protein 4 [Scatophagus argus]